MKVDKNSPLGEMLLKMAAEHDPNCAGPSATMKLAT